VAFWKKAALAGVALAVLAGGLIAARTVSFAPDGIAQPTAVSILQLPKIDGQAAAQNLGAAIRFKTISHQDPSENQMDQWDGLHRWLQATYPAAHAAMARETVADHALVYHWEGSDPALKPIILMAHQDVVPVTSGTEADWKHDPFGGEIADNAVWGRGSIDDKGSLIALFEAMEALAKQGFKPKRGIYLVSGHDEEAGGNGAKAAAALLASRGVKALFALDEGSAIVLDAPVVDAPVILIGVAEKGYATMKVTANATGGHSSMPPAETGVVNLAKAIIAINDKPFALELKGPGAQMLDTLAAQKGGATKMAIANKWLFGRSVIAQAASTPSGAAMFHTTIAPTMLQGSPKENVLPQSAIGLINYRIAPWDTSADVMARAKAAVGNLPVELSWVKPPIEPSLVSSTRSEGWKMVVNAARIADPKLPIAPFLVVGGTDSRYFGGVADDVYRFQPMRVNIADTKVIHGTNEHISIANLKSMIEYYARLISLSAA
jgi:carboxypeptidase PM20D1